MFDPVEVEELILYPAVGGRLERLKVDYRTGRRPGRIPPEQV